MPPSPKQVAINRIKELIAEGDEISGSSQIAARLQTASVHQLRNIANARTLAEVKLILFISGTGRRRLL